jgi:hypothetical protein
VAGAEERKRLEQQYRDKLTSVERRLKELAEREKAAKRNAAQLVGGKLCATMCLQMMLPRRGMGPEHGGQHSCCLQYLFGRLTWPRHFSAQPACNAAAPAVPVLCTSHALHSHCSSASFTRRCICGVLHALLLPTGSRVGSMSAAAGRHQPHEVSACSSAAPHGG